MRGLDHEAAGFSLTRAYGINNSGQIVGYAAAANRQDAFLVNPGEVMTALPELPGGQHLAVALDINDAGWIVGDSSGTNGGAVLWSPAGEIFTLRDFVPDTPSGTNARAINNLNQIVGHWASIPEGEGFIWDPEAGLTGLGQLAWLGEGTTAEDLNDHGQVVGSGVVPVPPGPTRRSAAFVWDAQQGMRRLDEWLDPCAPAAYHRNSEDRDGGLHNATAINNAGQIAANPWDEIPSVLLTPYLPGDLDEDRSVDIQDVTQMLTHFGRVGDADYADGDLDCDADVDIHDLTVLLSNYGAALP
jgi:probable HAF family extracellular repeat protein